MMLMQGTNNNSMINSSFMSNNSNSMIAGAAAGGGNDVQQQHQARHTINTSGYATSREYKKPPLLNSSLLAQPGEESMDVGNGGNGTPTLTGNGGNGIK